MLLGMDMNDFTKRPREVVIVFDADDYCYEQFVTELAEIVMDGPDSPRYWVEGIENPAISGTTLI